MHHARTDHARGGQSLMCFVPWLGLAGVLVVGGGVTRLCGQTSTTKAVTLPAGGTAAAEEGFVPLFNGKNLDGWKEVQGGPGSFHVADGILLGNRHEKEKVRTAYWLSTNAKYRNFVLRLEYQLPPGGNSGVFIRVPHHQDRTSRVGMEIQLMDDAKAAAPLTASGTGSIYQVVPPKAHAQKPAAQWNEIEIDCRGDRIRVAINGTLVNDASMNEHEKLKGRPREGYLGLSAHSREVKFRNIRLKKLPDTINH